MQILGDLQIYQILTMYMNYIYGHVVDWYALSMSVLLFAKKVEIILMMTENDGENFLPCFTQFLGHLIGWYALPNFGQ